MDYVKRNLLLIGCIAVGGAGIALVATGLGAMPKVVKEMDGAKGEYTELGGLPGTPANQRIIDAERKRIDAVLGDYGQIVDKAKSLCAHYRPLVEGIFPAGNDDRRREFRRAYIAALTDLMNTLKWGQTAQESDTKVMQEKIANERKRREEAGGGEHDDKQTSTHRTPAGILTADGARGNEKARADIAAAQRIYCYGQLFETKKPSGGAQQQQRVASLDFDPEMRDTGTVDAPPIEFCWRAQLGYWIQKDVVDAIAALNNEAAEALLVKSETPWVGTLPVKNVISIRMSQEYIAESEEVFGSAKADTEAAALPPATPKSVFTGTAQSADYEVLQFTVKLVMDPRHIPRLAELITGGRFHTLLRTAYRAVPPNREMTGKIYGSQPAAITVLDFESVALGEVFRPQMPAAVCEKYAIPCPPQEEAPAEGGGKDDGK